MNSDKGPEDTAEFLHLRHTRMLWPDSGSTKVQVEMASGTDRGLVRNVNEDHYLTARAGRWLETVQTSLSPGQVPVRSEEFAYGMLVADGMGGAVGGELASRTALSVMISLVLHTPDWIMSTGEGEVRTILQRYADRFKIIQEVLVEYGRDDPSVSEMGTTMTLTASFGNACMIGHIGDSRAYLLRDGKIIQLTRDHTYVQSMIDSGAMTPEEAVDHPWRHVLSRSLGGGGGAGTGEGDFQRVDLKDGDQLLLCTDGLSNMVLDGDIAAILTRAPSADDACRQLIHEALRNGGFDNVTVALSRYRFTT